MELIQDYVVHEVNVAEEVICGTTEVERIAEKLRGKHLRATDHRLTRRFPIGAEIVPSGGTHFRVWAPRAHEVAVAVWDSADASGVPARTVALAAEGAGYFSGHVSDVGAGTHYKLQLKQALVALPNSGAYAPEFGKANFFPDPASRFQPEGPHGPSQIVDPKDFKWTDQNWRGVTREGQVIYELHIGTFTREGTWRAAMNELPALHELGVTILEIMPVADFVGRFGWGYDGVNMFAPTRLYGSPDDMRAFVNRAHELGLGVILDVVYNHFGPDGNYVGEFSRDYFSARYKCEWGEALNFDGENRGPVREFFITNAVYWISEFHLDGLRLDATQQIFDDSPTHILAEIGRAVREAAGERGTFIVNENECQHTRLVRRPRDGGCGLDALWNDDFHHSARVAMTGRAEAYYSDYRGTPQELISAVKSGYLFQGQRYDWQNQRRGTPALDLHPASFVSFIQNHDQVANSLRGQRLHQLTSPGRLKAVTTLLLLAPQTPMLFMGQEFASSAPFLYFADHNPELAKLVMKGRFEFLKQFKTIACGECESVYDNPESEATFRRCVLDFSEREKNRQIYALHRDLLKLRRSDPAFSNPRPRGVDGAVLGPEALVLRFLDDGCRNVLHEAPSVSRSARSEEEASESQRPSLPQSGERLLVLNLGADLKLPSIAEPLLAPPCDCKWQTIFSTEQICYGGSGAPPVEDGEGKWWLAAHAATVLGPVPLDESLRNKRRC